MSTRPLNILSLSFLNRKFYMTFVHIHIFDNVHNHKKEAIKGWVTDIDGCTI